MPKTDALTVKTTLVADDEFIINDSEVVDPTTTVATKVVDRNNAYIYMKGYKEYTCAIRQSGTSAPVLTVERDDFIVSALPTSRLTGGKYAVDITDLALTLGSGVNVGLSNYRGDTDLGALTFGVYFSSATQLVLESRVNNLLYDDSFNDTNGTKFTITQSI